MELVKLYSVVAVIGFLAVALLFGLIRTIKGPRRPDRIMGINMIGSFSTALLAALSVFLKQNWLLDVCLVYCLISFLAVMILSKIHISESQDDRSEEEENSLYE
ncbi:MAG: sodium:proton antiporter [Lachnospiraceae bacterium]|nr:sodium:proton antiporter [Lachnospiraceae bacterium]MBR0087751.1 sodium:proton antiporter [Lachnospiraceae bacterium]